MGPEEVKEIEMGLFDRFKKPAVAKLAPVECRWAPLTVLSPVDGEAVRLADVPDEAFSQGLLGQGLAVKPSGRTVYAPVDGTVMALLDSLHAVALEATDGAQVLVHVGVDTVAMNGKGFSAYVAQGDTVRAGDPLLGFDPAAIADAGHPAEVMVLVSNSADYAAVNPVAPGPVTAGEKAITLKR